MIVCRSATSDDWPQTERDADSVRLNYELRPEAAVAPFVCSQNFQDVMLNGESQKQVMYESPSTFCWRPGAMKVTLAEVAGPTDHYWTFNELLA